MKPEKSNLITGEETLVFSQTPRAAKPGVKSLSRTADKAKKGGGKELPLWQSVLIGGVPGILLGAASSFASAGIKELADNLDSALMETVNEPLEIPSMESSGQVPQVAGSVTDGMSYGEAFAAARAEVGPGGAFVWHGNVYGTFRADDPEWQEMTSDERAAFSENVLAHVPRPTYVPTEEEPKIEVVEEAAPADEGDTVDVLQVEAEETVPDTPEEGTVDVHIASMEEITMDDGSVVPVGVGELNGQDAVFADTDGDGYVDTVMVDINGNGRVDDGEMMEWDGPELPMEDMNASLQEDQGSDIDLYSDMPDYTNDADAGSFLK